MRDDGANKINVIDNRIPKAAIDGPGGTAELRYGGPATERGASALVESGGKGFAVHADGFWRSTDDMAVPWYPRPLPGGGSQMANTILNSASRSYGGALGGSMVWDLACLHPAGFRAFVAISGSFWDPPPVDCAQPVDLLHLHGLVDEIVPIAGWSTRPPNHKGDALDGMKPLADRPALDTRQLAHPTLRRT